MRTFSVLLVLSTSMGFAQSPFYFTHSETPADMTAMATAIRTITDIQDMSVDTANREIVAHGPADKMVLADWLFHQFDKPAGRNQSGPVEEYQIVGQRPEVVRIFYVPFSTSNADISAAVAAIRTVADVQRLFPYESQKAIVARSSAAQIAAADWILRQLNPLEETPPKGDSPAYPSPTADPKREPDAVIRIFRMDPNTSGAELTGTVTAIRTVADVQRLFPYAAGECPLVRTHWGVPDEAKAESKVLPLCLAEIERCLTNFVGLFGERYGWVPEEIPEELLEMQPWLSVTALEILHRACC